MPERQPSRIGRSDAWVVPVLGAVTCVALLVILLVGRGLTFYNLDELMIFERGRWTADWLFEPFLDQLMFGTRVVFQVLFDTAGSDYTAYRVVGAISALLPAVLLFFCMRPRIGAQMALILSSALMFFGSAWEYLLWPFQSISIGLALSAGLGALMALERGTRGGNIAACALLCVGVSVFGLAVAFVVGAAVYVLLGADRRRLAWIFLIPLALYAAWWLWKVQGAPSHQVEPKNILVIPLYVANSFSSTIASLAGTTYNFGSAVGFNQPPQPDTVWAPVLAVMALAALGVRLLRGGMSRWFWAALGVVITYWVAGALVVGDPPNFRYPGVSRYLFPSAVMLLFLFAWAADGWRPSRTARLVVAAVAALALFGNLAMGRNGSIYLHAYADSARAQLAMLELARGTVDREFIPAYDTPDVTQIQMLVGAGGYLDGVDRYGSPAFSIPELLDQEDEVRTGADTVLVAADKLALVPGGRTAGPGCGTVEAGPKSDAELPAGGVALSSPMEMKITLTRFGPTPIEVGTLSPSQPATLAIPTDDAGVPWHLHADGSGTVRVCALDG